MRGYRYIDGTATLKVDRQRCIGCGCCVTVCPHRLFALNEGVLEINDADLCMECGACSANCPVEAIRVSPGVGCAVHILAVWLNNFVGRKVSSGCC